jgi:hypothetical protein
MIAESPAKNSRPRAAAPRPKTSLERVEERPDVRVWQSDYRRLLGYPRQRRVEGRARELEEWARRWYSEHGRPWTLARVTNDVHAAEGGLRVEGVRLSSGRLGGQLTEARALALVLVAVSAGRQCEDEAGRLWREGRPDESYFLEVYGSAVVERLLASVAGWICAWAEKHGLAALPHCSPGYAGWDLANQAGLLRLLAGTSGRKLPGELRALNTGMLDPKKSQLAVIGLARNTKGLRLRAGLIPCVSCPLAGCEYRRLKVKG